MTDRTKEILNFLESLANEYGLRLDKPHKHIIEEAITIIMRVELEPPEELRHFNIPAELE